jgi:hypothetical protein
MKGSSMIKQLSLLTLLLAPSLMIGAAHSSIRSGIEHSAGNPANASIFVEIGSDSTTHNSDTVSSTLIAIDKAVRDVRPMLPASQQWTAPIKLTIVPAENEQRTLAEGYGPRSLLGEALIAGGFARYKTKTRKQEESSLTVTRTSTHTRVLLSHRTLRQPIIKYTKQQP